MAELEFRPSTQIGESPPSLSKVLVRTESVVTADLVTLDASKRTSASTCFERVLSVDRPKILAEDTVRFLEVETLLEHLPTPQTTSGRSALYNSLTNPTNNFEVIVDRRDAIRYLNENPEVRSKFESVVKALGILIETSLEIEEYGLERLVAKLIGIRSRAEKVFVTVTNLPDVNECPLLLGIKEELEAFIDSPAFQDLLNPIGYSKNNFYPQSEFGNLKKIKVLNNQDSVQDIFRNTRVLNYYFGAMMGAGFIGIGICEEGIKNSHLGGYFIGLFCASLFGFMANECYQMPKRSKLFDNLDTFIRDQDPSFILSGKFERITSTFGLLDELCSQSWAKGNFLELVDEENHSIKLKNARNPQLEYSGENPVPIDIELDSGTPLAITGPKACGKTGAIKTILQIQLLTQAGFKAPAEEGRVCVADYIVMDAFEVSTLADGTSSAQKALESHGRIFNSIGPERAIAFFDELGQGASDIEVAPLIRDDYLPFLRDNNVTSILVLHNNDFVTELVGMGLVKPVCVKEAKGKPTYTLYEGVSDQSNYLELARRSGVSGENLRAITRRNQEARERKKRLQDDNSL